MNKFEPVKRSWWKTFADACRGIKIAVASEKCFWVHLPAATAVFILGFLLEVSLVEGLILGFCVTLVVTVELLNTAIETMAREVTSEDSAWVRDSLDVASGAVLVASLGAAAIGLSIFVPKMIAFFAG